MSARAASPSSDTRHRGALHSNRPLGGPVRRSRRPARTRALDRRSARGPPRPPSAHGEDPGSRRRRHRNDRRGHRLARVGPLLVPPRQPAGVRASRARPRVPLRRVAGRARGAEADGASRRCRRGRGRVGARRPHRLADSRRDGRDRFGVPRCGAGEDEATVYAGVCRRRRLELYGTAIGTWTWGVLPGLGLRRATRRAASRAESIDILALALAARVGRLSVSRLGIPGIPRSASARALRI